MTTATPSRHTTSKRWLGLALLGLGLLINSAKAAPLADQVPADAMFYVGWDGVTHKGPGYAGSHLEAVMKAAEFDKLVNVTIPQLLEKVAAQNGEAREAGQILMPILKPLVKHPSALWIGPVKMAAGEQPMPRFGIISKSGEDTAALHDHLAKLLDSAPRDVKNIVRLTKTADSVTVSANYGDGNPAAGGSLAASPAFKSIEAHLVPNATFAVFVDVEQLTLHIDKAVDTYSNDGEARQAWPKVRDAVGLRSVKRFVASSGFDGKEWVDQAFINAPEPRAGLVALADPTPLSDEALKAIPATATMAGAARFDLTRFFGGLIDAAVNVEPGLKGGIDDFFAQISNHAGFDVRKDLIDAFGPEWVYYSDPMTGGRGTLGTVFLNKLRDPAKAEATLLKVQKLIEDTARQQAQNQPVQLRFLKTESGGTTIHYVGLPFITPSWSVKNGYLVVALYPQMVAGAVDQIGNGKPSILDNPGYKQLRARLGVASANSVSFVDLPKTAPDGYAAWVAISRITGVAELFGVDSPAMILPPLGKLMPHLAPAGGVTWTDKDGIHAKALSPFPGATILANDPFANLGLLLPAAAAGFSSQRAQHAAEAEAHRAHAEEAHRAEAIRAQPRPVQPVPGERPR